MARAAGNANHYTFILKGRPNVTIELPSVTTIIKGVMGGNFSGPAYWGFRLGVEYGGGDYEEAKRSEFAPNAQRDKAGARGTKVHEYLEMLASGEHRDPEDGYEQAVEKWWGEQTSAGRSVVGCEVPLYSLKHGYAGTVDLILADDVGLTFVDLKTHKPPARFEDHLQVAAYNLAYQEMHPDVVGPLPEDHLVLMAKEDGTYEESWQWINPHTFPKVIEVWREVKAYGRDRGANSASKKKFRLLGAKDE